MLALLVALVLHPPVDGAVARAFDYGPDPFARGAHRGVDFHSNVGEEVKAACAGRVTHAGPTPHGNAVTIRCGRYAVTHLPLEQIGAPRHVRAGQMIGTAGGGHDGLHLGVRRADDPFGYIDPEVLLQGPPLGPAPPPVRRHPPSPAVVRPEPAPAREPEVEPRRVPWTVIAGAALLALATPAAALRTRAKARTAWRPKWARL